VIDVLAEVRAHLREHFARSGTSAEADEASVTFLGTERIDVLRFGPTADGVSHYVSVGCSRHPMFDPTEMVTDALHGPRAEVVVALRGRSPSGLARSIAILAAAPAVEGLILEPDGLIDLESPLPESGISQPCVRACSSRSRLVNQASAVAWAAGPLCRGST